MELYKALINDGQAHILHSLDLLKKCIELYGIEGVAFSFNGGKDCTVVFHLLRAVLGSLGYTLADINCIYFERPDEFEQLVTFMDELSDKYSFDLFTIRNDFKQGLISFLADHPQVKAIFMGQRKMDPHGGSLEEIHPSDSDKGWPHFQRVNPILHWTYREVWSFLKVFELEYCELYDEGYTSLGSKKKTMKNQALWDGNKYLPAFLLQDDIKERFGRETMSASAERSAGIIIIGQSIISGIVRDENSIFLCKSLRRLGIIVKHISIIPGEVDAIGKEVYRFSNSFDFVFTCGGVGPSSDDVTMLGIASGFSCQLVESPELLTTFKQAWPESDPASFKNMAKLPQDCDMIFGNDSLFPTVKYRNVFIFPGIPAMVQSSFHRIKNRFSFSPLSFAQLTISLEEMSLSSILVAVSLKFPDVFIGSSSLSETSSTIFLESVSHSELSSAFLVLQESLPHGQILSTDGPRTTSPHHKSHS